MGLSMRQCQKQLENFQKQGTNKFCFECKTANPQWASPKYGIYICLECAGTHRSLGVHISFVRSITMDQFKPEELKLMEIGGNSKAAEYFKNHGIDETVTIIDKYNSTVAEDYREKLLAEARGEPWTRRDRPVVIPDTKKTTSSTNTHTSMPNITSKKDPVTYQEPSLNDLASEAIGAISTGWGWLSKTVTKTVAETNETYIRPSMKQLAESEMGGNARRAVEQFGRKAREVGVYGAEQFNKYAVETMGGEPTTSSSSEFAHLFDGWYKRPADSADAAEQSTDMKISTESNVNHANDLKINRGKPKNTFKPGYSAEVSGSSQSIPDGTSQNAKKNE